MIKNNRVKIANFKTDSDKSMAFLEEVSNSTSSQILSNVSEDTTSESVPAKNQQVQMSLDEAQKKVEELSAEWTNSVNAHEDKNQEMVKHQEVTKKLHEALPEDTRTLLAEERSKTFGPMINQRYMCLVDAYKKLETLTTFVVNVKTEQLKTYNDVLAKIRDDANACPNCPCKKYFDVTPSATQ